MKDKVMTAAKNARKSVGGEIYLVGGAVRDILLGRKSYDLDFVVIGRDYREYAGFIAKELRSRMVEFKDNVRIPFRGGYIDISASKGVTLEEDLAKRDFTMNNLAMTTDGRIIGDRADLDRRLIVPVYGNAFDDDPLRILRGFRQAASLGFALSDKFIALAKNKICLLPNVAGERICEELWKLSNAEFITPEIYMVAEDIGLWRIIVPEGVDVKLMYESGSVNLRNDDRFIIFLAVMLHKSSDPRAVLNKLHTSKPIERGVTALLSRVDCFPGQDIRRAVWNQREVARLLLPFAHILGAVDTNTGELCENAYRRITEYKGEAVTGGDVTALAPGRAAGKWIASIIDECNYMLVFGICKNKNEAIEYAKVLLERI